MSGKVETKIKHLLFDDWTRKPTEEMITARYNTIVETANALYYKHRDGIRNSFDLENAYSQLAHQGERCGCCNAPINNDETVCANCVKIVGEYYDYIGGPGINDDPKTYGDGNG